MIKYKLNVQIMELGNKGREKELVSFRNLDITKDVPRVLKIAEFIQEYLEDRNQKKKKLNPKEGE